MEGGREVKREGTYINLWLTHVVVRQKSVHHKAIILQLKIHFKKVISGLQCICVSILAGKVNVRERGDNSRENSKTGKIGQRMFGSWF